MNAPNERTLLLRRAIIFALQELYRREGTQKRLAELAGITQSTINAYLSGKAKVENMPLGVFLRLFRDIKIDFFGGTTRNPEADALRDQLLEIFNALDPVGKARLLAMAAANFGDKLKEETK